MILDCTDNPATRYLLSDVAVELRKPLVSGAAQRFDGQLCTYNLGPDGPCYRCLFPRPPSSPETMPSCEETGILGAVTGVIGSLQALEAIKIIVGLHGKLFLSLFLSSNWREKRGLKKGKVERALTICFVRGLSGQMNSRPCWSTPRWVYRLSAASSSGSAALPALRVGLKVTR